MPESRTSMKRIASREREIQALELRKAGASMTQIAQALGYADQASAYQAVCRAIGRLGQEDTEQLRGLIMERLNDLYRRTTEILVRPHPVLHQGVPVLVTRQLADGSTVQVELDDDRVKLDAVRTLLPIMERTCRLMGLDMPVRVAVSEDDVQDDLAVRAADLAAQATAFMEGAEAERARLAERVPAEATEGTDVVDSPRSVL